MIRRQVSGLCPPWFVYDATKLALVVDRKPWTLHMKSRTAELLIEPIPNHRNWRVEWRLNHGASEMSASLNMSRDQLERAFGLKEGISEQSTSYQDSRFGTPFDAATMGAFVRFGPWLNIPGPAPEEPASFNFNISVEVTDEVMEAARAMLAHRT